MNAITPIAATPSSDPAQDRPEARALTLAEQLDAETEAMSQRHLRQLVEMQETGMGVTRLVKQRVAVLETAADGEDNTAALGELGLTFNRTARAVRLSMNLEARVRAERRARLLGLEAERTADAARKAQDETRHMQSRGDHLVQLVDDTVTADILREGGFSVSEFRDGEVLFDDEEEERIETVKDQARRLLRRKAYAGFEDRPTCAVLVELGRDLNIGPIDWSGWADDDWALDEAEDVEGSVFAGLSP